MGAIVAISMATSPAVLRRDEGNHSTADSPNGTTKDNYSASFDKVRKLDQLERETERAREQLGNAEEELTLVRGSSSFNNCEIKRCPDAPPFPADSSVPQAARDRGDTAEGTGRSKLK